MKQENYIVFYVGKCTVCRWRLQSVVSLKPKADRMITDGCLPVCSFICKLS